MPETAILSKFGELGGLIGLISGVLLIYMIYTHNQMSMRVTKLTDAVLDIVKTNSVALSENHEDRLIIAGALDKRQCMAGEGLKAKMEDLARIRDQRRMAAIKEHAA